MIVMEEKQMFNEINYKFDENGVVIYDSIISSFDKMISADEKEFTSDEVINPFVKEYPKQVANEINNDSSNWTIFKNIEFDENGIVIRADEII